MGRLDLLRISAAGRDAVRREWDRRIAEALGLMFTGAIIIAVAVAVGLAIIGVATSAARKSHENPPAPRRRLPLVLLIIAALSLLIMTVTGFIPAFGAGNHDWLMLIHAT